MSYIDVNYITKRTDQDVLEQVVGESNLSTSNIVLQSISDAEEIVNEYIENVYVVPLEDPPATIKRAVFNIALYYIYSSRYKSDIPENIVAGYDKSIKYLEEIKAQEHTVINETENTAVGTTITINKTSTDKFFTKARLNQLL